ncbi:MAG: 50S ribosomal protein L24 [Myxococcales bacterium]|nr:50S ribosomal protein L24 [Myxococcales bacterium]
MQRLKVGDLVQVISGKEKGKRGRLVKITDERVTVEGLNMVVRHTRPSQQNQEGGRIKKEGTIHISNVMPVDSGSDKPTRVKSVTVDGKKSRIGKSGQAIQQS